MDTKGTHLIMDVWLKKNEPFKKLKNILANTLMNNNQLILGFNEWEFYPQGNSALFLIATSHASVHTYPEHKYITIDVYTCDKNFNAEKYMNDLLSKLQVKKCKHKILDRGN